MDGSADAFIRSGPPVPLSTFGAAGSGTRSGV